MAEALYVHGLGHFHPESVISNQFLEALEIGTSDEWILERVGIRERRTILPLEYIQSTRNADLRAADEAALCSPLQMAERAVGLALSRAKLTLSDIGLVVAGGCVPSKNIPSDASRVAHALGLSVPGFDMNAACASFGLALHWLRLSGRALPEFTLVVNAEATTRVVDYRDRNTAVLWGDGATAAIVSNVVPARLCVTESAFGGDASGAPNIEISRFGHFTQQGSTVQRFAIKTMQSCLTRALDRHRSKTSAPDRSIYFIGHQANQLALDAVARAAGVSEQQHLHNVSSFGNTGAAGAPAVLSQHWDELLPHDSISIAVVGAGLSWAWLDLEVR